MNPIVKTIYHLMLRENTFVTDQKSNNTFILAKDRDVLETLQNSSIVFSSYYSDKCGEVDIRETVDALVDQLCHPR